MANSECNWKRISHDQGSDTKIIIPFFLFRMYNAKIHTHLARDNKEPRRKYSSIKNTYNVYLLLTYVLKK